VFLPGPEDSVYFHPTLNPLGLPPPGKPQQYKTRFNDPLAAANLHKPEPAAVKPPPPTALPETAQSMPSLPSMPLGGIPAHGMHLPPPGMYPTMHPGMHHPQMMGMPPPHMIPPPMYGMPPPMYAQQVRRDPPQPTVLLSSQRQTNRWRGSPGGVRYSRGSHSRGKRTSLVRRSWRKQL
jgi:hypothetical protein